MLQNLFQTLHIPTPTIPYYFYDPRLSRPCSISLSGIIPHDCEQDIDISLGDVSNYPKVDLPFQLSIQPRNRALVRRSYIEGVWSQEERHTKSDYSTLFGKEHFTLSIAVKLEKISVAINGRHEFDYSHRVPLSSVNTLSVNGNVLLDGIRYEF